MPDVKFDNIIIELQDLAEKSSRSDRQRLRFTENVPFIAQDMFPLEDFFERKLRKFSHTRQPCFRREKTFIRINFQLRLFMSVFLPTIN